jgi:cell fate regulator YaaT (PSP1 superfamily)
MSSDTKEVNNSSVPEKKDINIIDVKFRKQLRNINADAGELELKEGDRVVIETQGGPMLATVVSKASYKFNSKCKKRVFSKVLRMADKDDDRQEKLNIRMEGEYSQICQQKIQKYKLPMKLVDVEIMPDGSKVIFYFVSENRVDFRSLVKELASDLRTRIEMRQIGARSEAQKIGGIGCCGRELCCTTFLQKFCPVTVKMTKEQGLPLDPEKISGVCGRLMCCLAYEYETYVELKKGLPKVGKRIQTPQGAGKVKYINIVSKKISVELDDGLFYEMKTDDYKPDMLIKKK